MKRQDHSVTRREVPEAKVSKLQPTVRKRGDDTEDAVLLEVPEELKVQVFKRLRSVTGEVESVGRENERNTFTGAN